MSDSEPPKPETKRQASTRARRELILSTARQCFVEAGFHQTTMRDIAGSAGIALGNLYNHFDSKADLIAQIAREESQDLRIFQDQFDAGADPARALDGFVTFFVTYRSQPRTAALVAETAAEALRHDQVAQAVDADQDQLIETVSGILAQMDAASDPEPSLPPEDRARFVLDVITGAAAQAALHNRQPDAAEIAQLLRAVRRLANL